jgi:hypothetical protein
MPENQEKETRAKVGDTELERETRSRNPSADRYGDRYYDDDYRTRRGAAGIGDSVRDTARSVRRGSTDLISGSCDLIGGIFIGIGEAISPGRRYGESSGCSVCGTGGGRYDDDDDYYDSRRGGGGESVSRTEVRRTSR